MKRSEIFFSAILIPLDFLALLAAFSVAYYLRDSVTLVSPEVIGSLTERVQYNPASTILPFGNYLHYVGYIIPAMIAIFAFAGLYSIRSTTPFLRRLMQIVIGVSGGEFFILLLFLLKREFFLPRTTLIYSWILGIVFVTLVRYLVRLSQKFLYRYNIGVVRVGVIGNTQAAKDLMSRLRNRMNSTYSLAARFDGVDVNEVVPLIDKDKMDELVVMSTHYANDDLILLRNRCLEHHIGFSFVPPLLTALDSASYDVRHETGIPMIEVRPTPLEGWGRVFKRFFDVLLSIVLIIIFSPLYLLIILMQKSANPGPLFIHHARIGRGGKKIHITKFRSMKLGWTDEKGKLSANFQNYLDTHPEALKEWKETVKLKDDPRISGVGKILRKTRLDELPQFFNVLSGSLSLVGPRPVLDWEVEKFGEKARILFTVRPGVTGPWQVEGGNDLSYDDRVRLNADYIEHWTPWRDIVILIKTAWLVIYELVSKLFGHNAESGGY
jgi:exopolysaccharide biosynthesis polyprenyl glycosylphosphotransferase